MKSFVRKLSLFALCTIISIFVICTGKTGKSISEVSHYYLIHFNPDSGALNAVTSIYLNYRVFDTMLETLILLICVIAVIHFSWRKDHDE
jgi:multicomponent Na+:H+ antiporter subunit B